MWHQAQRPWSGAPFVQVLIPPQPGNGNVFYTQINAGDDNNYS